MIWKLLRQHVSPGQLAGFTLANLFGTAVVLLGLQFYADVSPLLTGGGSFMKKDYLVVSRRVSTLGTLTGTAATCCISSGLICRGRRTSLFRDL